LYVNRNDTGIPAVGGGGRFCRRIALGKGKGEPPEYKKKKKKKKIFDVGQKLGKFLFQR
jgi:hypothetical protein